jgi:hypothetical protein
MNATNDKLSAHAPSWRTMARTLRAVALLSQPGGSYTQEIARELGINDREVTRTILPALATLGLRVETPDAGKAGINHRFKLANGERVKTARIGFPKDEKPLLESLLAPDEWMLLSFLLNSGGRLAEQASIKPVLLRLRAKLSEALHDASINTRGLEFAAYFDRLDPFFEYLGTGRRLYAADVWETTVGPLLDAAARRKVCAARYHSFSAEAVKDMAIMPLRLIEHDGGLYMLSMSAKHRNAIMPLEIGRFQAVEVSHEDFEDPGVDLDAMIGSRFAIFFDQPRAYRIRFSPAAARHIREKEWAAGQEIIEEAGGSIVLAMTTAGYVDVKRWVLNWGAEAEALEPAELRQDVAATLRAALERYTGD